MTVKAMRLIARALIMPLFLVPFLVVVGLLLALVLFVEDQGLTLGRMLGLAVVLGAALTLLFLFPRSMRHPVLRTPLLSEQTANGDESIITIAFLLGAYAALGVLGLVLYYLWT